MGKQKEVCFVTGGTGLVGTAIKEEIFWREVFCSENIVRWGHKFYDYLSYGLERESEFADIIDRLSRMQFIFASSSLVDLRNLDESRKIFERYKPTCVIHLAAKVGGLFANMDDNIGFFRNNMSINETVIVLCHEYKVKRVIFCLSTCIFPANITEQLTEDMIHNGPPHASNEGYAIAKRNLEMLVRFYRKRYGYDWFCVIPTNIYGENDNFSIEGGHVIPALVHKCYLSKKKNEALTVLGSGKPLRQFIYSSDLAKILLKILLSPSSMLQFVSVIIAPDDGDEYSIGDIATLIAKHMELEQPIIFETSKADGIFKKTASNKVLRNFLGPHFEFTNIDEGIRRTQAWFKVYYNICRTH